MAFYCYCPMKNYEGKFDINKKKQTASYTSQFNTKLLSEWGHRTTFLVNCELISYKKWKI